MKLLKTVARSVLETASTYDPANREARTIMQLEKQHVPRAVTPSRKHLEAAIGWLKVAQDANETGGVAWGYRARRPIRTDLPLGWIGPYPETTGYIIPTMLRFSELSRDEDSARRARRMAEWELSIQLADGGFQGGILGTQPVASSTFVTGQVLFGLLAVCRRFREDSFKTAALAAGHFLTDCLDDSGRFVKGYSHFCAPGAKAYEVRTGLALAELGDLLAEDGFRSAASRMADYALSMQRPNGWFMENDLSRHDQPLTHTIGYVLEGLEGVGEKLGRVDCADAVQLTLNHLVPLIRSDGFLAGRWREDWSPAVDSACLTGSSQLAGVFLRQYKRLGKPEYLDAGRKLLGFVCFTQDLRAGTKGLDGGIRGSYPFQGEYGQWSVLNWATKFFCDSTMDYLALEQPASLPQHGQ